MFLFFENILQYCFNHFIPTETKFHEDDITSVIKLLGPNEIRKLFGSLGLSQTFIDRNKKAVRSDVETQAKEVLLGWIARETPTIDDLLKALEKAGNRNASEELQEKWGISKQ